MVQYFRMEGAPGKYFACAPYGTMSVASCAKNFATAPEITRSGRLQHCIGCKVGRKHCGGAVAVPAPTLMTYRFCVRCRHSGRDNTSRLIGRMRLVRGQTICVSCYNREREVLKGANAKGALPKKWRGLYMARLGVIRAGNLHVEQLSHPVHDLLEAMLTMVREKDKPQYLGWIGRPVVRGDA